MKNESSVLENVRRALAEHREVRLVVHERGLSPGTIATVFWYGTVLELVDGALRFAERGDGHTAHVVPLDDVLRLELLDVVPVRRLPRGRASR